MSNPCKRFRSLLNSPGIIRSLGAHDVFSARVVELAGLETVFLGGFGVSASLLGLPDVGLTTLSEMVDAVARMAKRVNIPVVADGDTGHGDLHNVARTVREFEAAGAAGILLEDQTNPKRCGHFQGKQIVPTREWILRLKAAQDARKNPDFVIIARTDSLAIDGVNAAIDRANQAAEAGADVCFIEAPQTREQLERIPREVPHPLLVNMLTGGVTPILPAQELEKLGYKIVVCPIESLMVAGAAIQQLVNTFLQTGRVDIPQAGPMFSFKELKETLGLADIAGLKDRLDPVVESAAK
ncbi:MAG: isocitrate lyase/PEP mutase family protein [Gemmataceae bacterium]|nr:isocitrate lyase/PEP mutase family protein [Gemmataceae bacterium]